MKLVSAKCPSCGAKIEVDANSNSTRCDYCNSQVLVEDAIKKYKVEISGSIEIKNLPKLENYLKLADRHYKDGEYREAYEIYCKAIELDPDNYIVVLRKGLTKSLCCNYKNFEIKSAINGMKNAYSILKNENEKNKINNTITECNNVVCKLEEYIISFYNSNVLDLNEIINYISKLQSCVEAFEYLNSIIIDNNELKIRIMQNVINTISTILENKRYNSGNFTQNGKPIMNIYKLNISYRNSLLGKRQKYITECSMLKPNITRKDSKVTQANKVNKVTNVIDNNTINSVTKIIGKILSYIMIAFSILISIAEFSNFNFWGGLIWIIVAIAFIPIVKDIILKKNENFISLVIVARIMLVIFAFVITAVTSPPNFENTWISDNGIEVTLKNNNASITLEDGTELNGNYTYTSNDSNYSITVNVTSENYQNIEYKFKYIKNKDTVRFYLLEDNKATVYFIPESPNSSYTYLKE